MTFLRRLTPVELPWRLPIGSNLPYCQKILVLIDLLNVA
jgi:hypothetical protein